MNRFSLANLFPRVVDIRPGDARPVVIMASLLFFLLAAINVIKVVRDSLFLGRFPIDHLPYVYLLAAFFGGLIIAVYTRFTARLPLYRLILGANVFFISNLILFWVLIGVFDFSWAIYAFYIWSAIVSVLAVAQYWTFVGSIFNSRQAKRLFGIFAAGGSLGAVLGGFASGWTVYLLTETNQLFWLIEALFVGALGVVWFSRKELSEIQTEAPASREAAAIPQTGALGLIRGSRYLQWIAGVLFISVVVSTLIDFEFKAAAKAAHLSQDDLTAFFGSYYAWVAIITLFSQVFLTGKLLSAAGLIPSLLLLPAGLFVAALGMLMSPGLFSATAARLTDAVLRTSVNQGGIEMLYLPLSSSVKRQVKTFLDVVLQRLGDGAAGLIVLFYALFMMQPGLMLLSYLSLGLIVIWAVSIFILRSGYLEALRTGLEARTVTWEGAGIDYADKRTIEAVLENVQRSLEREDERALLFGLDLAEKLDPEIVVPRLPLGLLQHHSPLVRTRSLKLFASGTRSTPLKEILPLLQDDNREVQAEAINLVCAIRKEDAIPVMRPYLENPDPRVRRSAIECLLHHGDAEIREVAMAGFRTMIASTGTDGAASRMEAAVLMGEIDDPEFSAYLSKLIREDPSTPVIREALIAAGKRKQPALLADVVMRLCCPKTKSWARQALIEYGEVAVPMLREALLDFQVSRDIRLSIPRTLSKIVSPVALGALVSGLSQEDGSLRYKIILGLEEISRYLPDFRVDRHVIEEAIVSEARRYHRRFLTLFALFGAGNDHSRNGGWLLHQSLLENMAREKERVLMLLALIYPTQDIQRATVALRSDSPARQAQAIEFLDNLLTGDLKRHVFPLFDDTPSVTRFERFLALLGLTHFNRETALHELLKQDDVWLKAATMWEIGLRGFRGFKVELQQHLSSTEPVLKETAELVISRI